MSSLRETVKNIGMGGLKAQLLRSKWEAALRAWNKDNNDRRYADTSRVHISDLIGAEWCERQAYYKYEEGKQGFVATSLKTLLTWYEGVKTEEQFKELCRWSGIPLLRMEQKQLTEKIVGSIDTGVHWWGKRWVVEVKSLHLQAWRALKAPTRAYLEQAAPYMALYKCARSLIAVKGKGADDWKFFEVYFKDVKDIAREILQRGVRLHRAITEKRVPHRFCESPNDKKAKRCAFRDKCFFARDRNVA